MAKATVPYEDFLLSVAPEHQEITDRLNSFLLRNGCSIKIEPSKSGYVVSYHPADKKVIANFVFRKSGLLIRIYGDHVHGYGDLLETLPEGMKKAIHKASVCRRLLDPEKCNARCPKGYTFTLEDKPYQKCRYSSFMFPVNGDNADSIQAFLEKELVLRSA